MNYTIATYRLTPSTTTLLILRRGDITTFTGDALVNAANERMLGGGGVDGAIHAAAGPQLLEACKSVPPVHGNVRCPTGEARITPGNFNRLLVKHVIHTVGPVYQNEAVSAPLLRNCYKNSLQLANEHALTSIAFPAISSGVFGYPLESAAKIALETCRSSVGCSSSVKSVYFYLFGEAEVEVWRREAERQKIEKVQRDETK